jgi:hypothetical protein
VDRIIYQAGGKPGMMWCGFAQVYIWKVKCGYKQVGNGIASSWFPKNRLVKPSNAMPGDHAGVSYNKKTVQHVTMVHSLPPGGKLILTLEGNYGNGFKLVTRPKKDIFQFARWWHN